MDIETLHANRKRLVEAWLEGRRDGEWGVGPILWADNRLAIFVSDDTGRTRDVVIMPDGTITHYTL